MNFELVQRCQIAAKREVLKSVIITLKGAFLFQNIQIVWGPAHRTVQCVTAPFLGG